MSIPDDTQIQNEDDRERSRQLSLQGNRPPGEIDGYTFVRRLGTGAYGTVWLAREERTGRMVAVKFYPHRRGLNWTMLSREVEKLAAVYTSRNIVRLLDVGWNAEPPYFVMEFVENGSLGSFLARGALSVDEAVRITDEICSALIDAHGAGVLHCDLKPDNVLLDGQLHARICDFGQARMSHEQSPSLGTLYYMAPEQADLDAVPDARWDVYAVGALLFHMLTGAPPYRTEESQRQLQNAETLADRLHAYQQIITQSAPPQQHRFVSGVDTRLADLIDRCLARNPADRLPNAQSVRDELDSRERNRSRRPLLLLGVVGPALLMAALIPLFVSALSHHLRTTENRLMARALESDALSARLQAGSLQDELDDRLEELENVLADEEVATALEDLMLRPSDDVVLEMHEFHDAPPEARPQWMQLLDSARERADEANRRRSRSLDTSWFLTDVAGTQIWRRDFSSETVGKNYSWRDYFHGLNTEFDPDEVPLAQRKPITERHVSLAFLSEATNRYMVALSVPLRNRRGEVIGVFARTAHLGDLQARLGQRFQNSNAQNVHRIIALADSRNWQLLDHPFLSREVLTESSGDIEALFRKLRINHATVEHIRSQLQDADSSTGNIRISEYADPVAELPNRGAEVFDGEWMAAMAPIESMQSPWMVIVQERRDEALQPVADMATQATRQAWIAVITGLSLMGIVWTFVWRGWKRTMAPRGRTRGQTSDHLTSQT
ncbi:MAG: protein kinase [Planctomycetaceae bacterium]|nr:protein kinase [Planctomycetaceae bacterium]